VAGLSLIESSTSILYFLTLVHCFSQISKLAVMAGSRADGHMVGGVSNQEEPGWLPNDVDIREMLRRLRLDSNTGPEVSNKTTLAEQDYGSVGSEAKEENEASQVNSALAIRQSSESRLQYSRVYSGPDFDHSKSTLATVIEGTQALLAPSFVSLVETSNSSIFSLPYSVTVPTHRYPDAWTTRTHPLPSIQPRFEIFIKTLTGSIKTCYFTPGDTCLQLKEQIEVKEGMPIEDQYLVYRSVWMPEATVLGYEHRNVTISVILPIWEFRRRER
jgi:hypothetical protein